MRIKNKTASNYFFGNTSLEFVYFEAIANSIDAGATVIDINIKLPQFQEHDQLNISISDNGVGFNNTNFERFCHVLEAQDELHKGVGRLVYLNYFDRVNVDSFYGDKFRFFTFDDNFEDECTVDDNSEKNKGTTLQFEGYRKDKIKEYSYVVPEDIIHSILEHFMPLFYQMKMDGKKLKISVNLEVEKENIKHNFRNSIRKLNIDDLPELNIKEIPDDESLFSSFKMLYSIEHDYISKTVITAICADGRTIPIPIITNKQFPHGYKLIFILYSDYFDGKSNTTRETMQLDEGLLKKVKKIFSKMVSEIIEDEMPEIAKENQETKTQIDNQYPHLAGYIPKESIGLVDKSIVVSEAQSKYFTDQKEILEATSLTKEQFEKSLEFSSRVLTQYILYRDKILKKLKSIDYNDNEATIHELLVPKRRTFSSKSRIDDIFVNNAWVIDDKFMSYSKILSEREIEDLFSEINVEGKKVYSDPENGRPDITVVFSEDPEHDKMVDVVVIELKKLGLELAKKEEIYSQLKQRARRLLEFYPNKIQRLWFYGIIDFTPEFRASLIESGFTRLYSTGELYYRRQEIVLDPLTLEKEFADIFLLSYETMLNDATTRNSTFLEILKDSVKNSQD